MGEIRISWRVWLSILGIIVLVLPSCGPGGAPATQQLPPIKIGHIGEYTGFVGIYGAPQKAGIEYALDEVGWQIAGRKIELISEDGASDPATAVEKARKLAEVDKVDIIIGPLLGGSYEAVTAYLQGPGTPMLSLMMMGVGLGEKLKDGTYKNVFMSSAPIPAIGYALGRYAYEKAGYRTASLLDADYPAGWEFNGGFQVGFEELGGKVVQRQKIPMGTIDFAPYISSIDKTVDTVVYFLPGNALLFHKQYYAAGMKIPLMEPDRDSMLDSELQQLGDNVLGLVGSGVWSTLVDSPENKAFVDGWVTKNGNLPEIHNDAGYAAAKVFLKAVEYTKGDTSHQAIINAMHNIEVKIPRGKQKFDAMGIGNSDIYIFEVVKVEGRNDWKPIATYPQKIIWQYPMEASK